MAAAVLELYPMVEMEKGNEMTGVVVMAVALKMV